MQVHYYKFWNELIKPKGYEVDKESLTSDYGKFTVRPLERGYGVTLGNSLRRILLSSMMGSTVSALRIDGVLHEFTTVPDVMEDVADIILNLKQVRFRQFDPNPQTVRIQKKGPGKVTAADIVVNDKVEVLNKEQVICTLRDNANFSCELIVRFGRGYVPAENQKNELPV